LNEFNAVENVMMPLRIAGLSLKEARKRAEGSLDELGMLTRRLHFPAEMSGGEQQRVSIARALICSPEVLFADEPTGNLDSTNAHKIQELFFDLKQRRGLTLVVVTHDRDFAARFPKLLTLRDGRWADVKAQEVHT
jgi:predicted ABC-type transport system involved in lysophospholipase L1 biosynthesis ATPase subunit